MSTTPIRNSADLKAEIFRLERIEVEKAVALKARFNSPAAIISSVFSLFSTPGAQSAKGSGIFGQDFVGLISRFLLPLTLNKTFFRHSNFLVKTFVSVLSQKASHYISEDSVGSFWHKLTGLFEGQPGKGGGILSSIGSIFRSKKSQKPVNYPANTPVQQNVLRAE